jgi:hypothetical protein
MGGAAVEPVSAAEIRGGFVNSTKSLVKAMTLPRDFDELPWESLDYLGWRDPKAPARAYLVVPRVACSLYVRGLRDPEVQQGETVGAEIRVDRLGQRLDSFVSRVLA